MVYKGETKKKKEASRDKEQAGTGTGTERHETRALKGAQRAESVERRQQPIPRSEQETHTGAYTGALSLLLSIQHSKENRVPSTWCLVPCPRLATIVPRERTHTHQITITHRMMHRSSPGARGMHATFAHAHMHAQACTSRTLAAHANRRSLSFFCFCFLFSSSDFCPGFSLLSFLLMHVLFHNPSSSSSSFLFIMSHNQPRPSAAELSSSPKIIWYQ